MRPVDPAPGSPRSVPPLARALVVPSLNPAAIPALTLVPRPSVARSAPVAVVARGIRRRRRRRALVPAEAAPLVLATVATSAVAVVVRVPARRWRG